MITTSAEILSITTPFIRFMEEVVQQMQGSSPIKSTTDTLHEFMDDLITGNVHWPSASVAVSNVDIFLMRMSESDRQWAIDCANELVKLPSQARRSFIEAIERDERDAFRRMLKALYEAYYTSPQVIERVRAFAMSGPSEPSPIFDGSLVQNVIRTQAGKRRL
ncbi:MAG: hypothetical protein ABWY78_21760 [Microvirga sp.]